MKKLILFITFLVMIQLSEAQLPNFNPLNEIKFEKYVKVLPEHFFDVDFDSWKLENHPQYSKELWYFSKSFYIEKDHLEEGIELDKSIIDISRFETQRKENVEVIIMLDGFKDAIVLLPNNKLIYKPFK